MFPRAGAVAFIQGIEHPAALAREVMTVGEHVLLAGAGAEKFAAERGIPQLHLPLSSRQTAGLAEFRAKFAGNLTQFNRVNRENHDTIAQLCVGLVEGQPQMAGVCTTSGLAYKHHGRVGDSPIIGAGTAS